MVLSSYLGPREGWRSTFIFGIPNDHWLAYSGIRSVTVWNGLVNWQMEEALLFSSSNHVKMSYLSPLGRLTKLSDSFEYIPYENAFQIWKNTFNRSLSDLLRRLIRLLNMTLQWHHLRSTFHKSKISLETFFFLCNIYVNLNTSPCKICKTMFVYFQAQNNNVISVKSILINNILLFSSQICTWWY